MSRCLLLAIASALMLAGCNSFDLSKSFDMTDTFSWGKAAKEEEEEDKSLYPAPETMIAIWTESMYSEPGKPPMRGFGGRLYFYDKSSRPIPVDGELACYGFDDTHQQSSGSSTPDRKFVFTREQLTKHFGDSDIGASYSIWLPWDQVGNPNKEISLYPVFKSANGAVIRAQPSRHTLPGKKLLSENQKRGFFDTPQSKKSNWITQGPDGVRAVSHAERAQEPERRVSTFRMPGVLRETVDRRPSLEERAAGARQAADDLLRQHQEKRVQELQRQINAAQRQLPGRAPAGQLGQQGQNPNQAPGTHRPVSYVEPQAQGYGAVNSNAPHTAGHQPGMGVQRQPIPQVGVQRPTINRQGGVQQQRVQQPAVAAPRHRGIPQQSRMPRSSSGAMTPGRMPINARRATPDPQVIPPGAAQQSVGFQYSGPQAQATPYAPPVPGRVPTQPYPAAPQFGRP